MSKYRFADVCVSSYCILVTFNILLSKLLLNFLYILPFVALVPYIFIDIIKARGYFQWRYWDIKFSADLGLLLVFLCAFIIGIIQLDISSSTMGMIELFVFPIVTLTLVRLGYGSADFPLTYYSIVVCAFIVGFSSFYQYYYDPLLFDLFTNDSRYGDNWSSISIKRTPGLAGNIQSYMLLINSGILLFMYRDKKLTMFRFFFLSLMSFFAIIGGSQFSIVVIMLVLIYFFRSISFLGIILIGFGGILAIFVFDVPVNLELSMQDGLKRFIDIIFSKDIFATNNIVRVERWLDAFKNLDLLFGNGAGSASLLVDGGVRTNLESGFISYIYQIGLLFTLIFLSCFAWLIAYSYKFHFSSKFVISLIFFLGYFFLGHAMFGVYGFIVFIATFILNKDDSRFG
jgi:hypothetical protein